MAITSEQIWEIAPGETQQHPGDAFVLGRPARIVAREFGHLLQGVDWSRVARSTTVGFFDDRDPGCSVRSTVAKILAVIVVVTAITLVAIGTLAALGAWAIEAILS
jgi:hypothetical protein